MKLLKILLVVALVGVAFRLVLRPGEPITASVVAAQAQKRYTFPVDLGDGWRLDSVTASGNDLVSTITMTDETSAAPPAAVRTALETATRSDVCREVAAVKDAYAKHRIRIVKTYRNASGAEWLSVTVDPATCT